ncbi:MAG TPA: AzlD domain-containing protein [Hyphomicrobiales bacterium]|nr:AzlD domain-containing protein [Rhodobiaceae bacterium]HXK53429.1 AzlD domain-containing protein [Hyphomicrobiales bacterium]
MTVETIGWLAFLLVAGVLATDIWRVAGVFAALRVSEDSEVFKFVRAVATALVAALIARLVFFSPGVLAQAPVLLRAGAFAAGFIVFLGARRSIAAGILAGEAVLLAGLAVLGS